MYGYERSVPYPNGHRNVIWAERGHKTLSLPKVKTALAGRYTALPYAYLRSYRPASGKLLASLSATSQGTDWARPARSPTLEPFVELFQGFQDSYEAPRAPKSISDKTERIHGKFEPAGFVSLALEKGYKLGFQSSSDHHSTHVSYACIIAEEFSRKGLVDAMKKRHSYAATDNIILDFRCGAALMGDETRSAKPKFDVVVLGTGPIATAELLRNNQVVQHWRGICREQTSAELRFDWEDAASPQGERPNYYYVRVI